MSKVFGWQHLTYLAVVVVVAVVGLVLAKIFIKDSKKQMIFIKILAGLTLVCNLGCRIAVIFHTGGVKYAFPYTICAMTSFVLPLAVLFGKGNSNLYQALWYLGIVGGIGTLVYPDFLSQNESFFYPATFLSMLHHTFVTILCFAMVMFKWFRPNLKKCYYFPMIFAGYITLGTFAQHVLGIDGSMLITKPILKGTPINCWFILVIGTACVALVALVYELIKKRSQAKNSIQNTNPNNTLK